MARAKAMAEKTAEQERTSGVVQPRIEDTVIDCHKCSDKGYTFEKRKSEFGNIMTEVAIECECMEQKSLVARFKGAMIPEEFENARFDNYIQESPVQKLLYQAMVDYLKEFERIRTSRINSIGFIAEFGETRLKNLPYERRAEMRKKNNSYGLGKTHLHVAAAKFALKRFKVPDGRTGRLRGIRILIVQDVNIMAEIQNAMFLNDNKKRYYELLHDLTACDVLVWDDLGKSRHSEAKEDVYYQIFNGRYLKNLPVWYTSNEDQDTLEEKIGYAAADRLFGMSKDYLYHVKGASFRTN
ncbi:DNA replication protein [Bacillus cereus group sp. MYBK234-2]|uniref:DNA replication protein n=2 Tax=unclassified Bacillus cereus group TaxID=2750818 RepID=UPI003F79BBA1